MSYARKKEINNKKWIPDVRRNRLSGRAYVPACVGVILSRSAKNPPACHSEPTGEESRFAQVYFVRLEILRFAQDDKLGVVGRDGRAGACSRR